jgi:YegS/Rv2252/BmrU family lipid kinase
MTRRLRILCNPTAGGGKKPARAPEVEAALRARGLDFALELTSSPEHTAARAREAAENGEEVVAFGGDGMLRIVAHAIRGTDAVLGLLPGGRGNDFGHVLGIPPDPVAACEILADGEVRDLDAAEVDGDTFVGIASLGLDSIVNKLANDAPKALGRASYGVALFGGLRGWQPVDFELVLDGTPRSFTGYTVAVANSGRYGGGMKMAPDARLDDGLLDVVVIEDIPIRRLLRSLPKIFTGTHVNSDKVHVLQAREVSVAADRTFELYADGDPIGHTPATVRALPGALRFRAPRDAARQAS